MPANQHSPTPWRCGVPHRGPTHDTVCIYAADDTVVMVALRPEVAAHIVRYVNAHEGLVAALRGLLAEHRDMNNDLHTMGRGRTDNSAHPDAPAQIAREALRSLGEEV